MKRTILLLSCVILTGCYPQKTGPYALSEDSVEYNQALQSSLDSQLLLNIVRLRYRDTPTFLQVGVISAAYENTCAFGADFRLDSLNRANSAVSITPRINVDRKEKPTTTYSPVRGEGFVKEFLSPISVQSLVLLNSSGWKIDRILRSCVQRLNGINNAPTASGPTPDIVPDYKLFLELCDYFRDLENNDAIDLVLEKHPETGKVDVYLVIDKEEANPQSLSRIWEILELEPGLDHIRLVPYHGRHHRSDEINIDLRSPISLLYFLSQGVHVPEIDKMLGKVTVTADDQGNEFSWDKVLDGIMKVHSGPVPCGASPTTVVYYRGSFFYILDTDLNSKSTFSMLSQLLALQITCPNLPVTTLAIPLN
jgi:hypothetical protein